MDFVSDCSVISAWRFSSSSISHFSHAPSLRNLLFRWSSIDTNLPSSKLFFPSLPTSNITCLSLCWSITGEEIHGRLDNHVLSSNFFRSTNSFQINDAFTRRRFIIEQCSSTLLFRWTDATTTVNHSFESETRLHSLSRSERRFSNHREENA